MDYLLSYVFPIEEVANWTRKKNLMEVSLLGSLIFSEEGEKG